MNGFWDLKCTDERTQGRTDRGEFKGPNRLRRGTKNQQYIFHMKIKSKQSFQSWLGQTVYEMLIFGDIFGDF